jgi:hypothetical protein
MQGYEAIPIISDKQSLRLEPYKTDASASSIPSPVGNGRNESGQSSFSSPTVQSAVDDGELTPEEVQDLQTAADGGDFEADALLKGLGIGAGAAALGGAGYLLSRAMRNRGAQGSDVLPDGSSKFVSAGTPEFDAAFPDQPGSYYRGQNYPVVPTGEVDTGLASRIPPEVIYGQDINAGQRMLPAPTRQITDQTGGRFNQAGPQPQLQITDQDRVGLQRLQQQQVPPPVEPAKPPKARSMVPAGGSSRLGQTLRNAARAARGIR